MEIPRLPSRFENMKLSKNGSYTLKELQALKSFIFEDVESIRHIRKMITTMKASNSGAFLVLKGESGSGKTTFLNTLPLYISDLKVQSIYNTQDLNQELEKLVATNKPRILILENRETVEALSSRQLEKEIHLINKFIRDEKGQNTIVVWPCNGEEMTKDIIQFAGHIGGSSLFRDDSILEYKGPNRNRYKEIMKLTFQFFNQYDVSDIGISDELAQSILDNMKKGATIGSYLESVRTKILEVYSRFGEAKKIFDEKFNLIIVIIAGNNPIADIDFLTKGERSCIDFERLMSTSKGNIVKHIKRAYSICAIAAKELNCKLVTIDYRLATDLIRYEMIQKDTEIIYLEKLLYDNGIKPTKARSIIEALRECELVKGINNCQIPKRKTSANLTTVADEDFKKLLNIARENDRLLNKKICELLKEQGHIQVGRVEESFGLVTTVRSDMICSVPGQYFRVEFMWRESATSGIIASYTLKKIYNYCYAMGLL